MYIALFTDTYDEINGVGMTLRQLSLAAFKKGIFLEVFCPGELKRSDPPTLTEKRGTVKIHRYKPVAPLPIYSDLSFDLKFIRNRIVTYCEQAGFDLIHTATPGSMGLTALFISHTQKIPLIGSYHTSLPLYVKKRVEQILGKIGFTGSTLEEATWQYLAWYYQQCKLVLAPSESTKKELEEKFKNIPIKIFSRGIDTGSFNPEYRSDKLIEKYGLKRPLALYVGRVSIEKNLNLLVEIFGKRKSPQLVVVGDGPYLAEMKKALPSALFLGFIQGAALSEVYASSDFFIFPSATDTFGNVVLEALASGLPAIVSDEGGPKELVIDGQTGFVVKAGDMDELKEKIDLLCEENKMRKNLSGKAVEYTKKMSWEAVFTNLFSVYNETS
ncbi:MAG: glycosyltransferase family 1 protein [bacterium]|nr:glycosyltransferase family 1 protein [bacterium]